MIPQNTAAQKRALPLAGALNGFTEALHETADNLSKPDFDTAAPGVSRPVRAREGLTIIKMVSTWQSLSTIKNGYASLTASVKKDLLLFRFTGYGNSAPAKSGAGIGVPEIITATPDAPSVFFCVVHSVHLFFCVTVIIRAAHRIMVGCVGASFEAPVSVVSGYANPIQSTTLEIGVSGGGYLNHTSEAAIWLLPTPKNHPLSGLSAQFAAIAGLFPHKSITSKQALNVKHVRRFPVITLLSLPDASVRMVLMLNKFTVLGYATNQRGLTVGINYQITSDSTAKATAHAMLQAQRNGLTRIRITRVEGGKP